MLTVTSGVPATTGTATVISQAVDVPGRQAGDISMVCMTASGSSVTATPPAGWTPLFGAGGTRSGQTTAALGGVWWRAWAPGDPTSVTFTLNAIGRIVLLPLLLRGADLDTPVEASSYTAPATTAAAGTNVAAPTLTAVKARVLLCLHGVRGAGSGSFPAWTPPAGMTELVDVTCTSVSTNACAAVSYKAVAPGATGVQNAVPDALVTPMGFSVLLVPQVEPSVVRMKGGVPVTVRRKSGA